MEVHGITNEFLADKPRFEDIMVDLLAYLRGAELIIHNAPFDIGFLNHELRLVDPAHPPLTDCCTVTDTLRDGAATVSGAACQLGCAVQALRNQ